MSLIFGSMVHFSVARLSFAYPLATWGPLRGCCIQSDDALTTVKSSYHFEHAEINTSAELLHNMFKICRTVSLQKGDSLDPFAPQPFR